MKWCDFAFPETLLSSPSWGLNGKKFFLYLFEMLANEREKLELLKWLSKAIITINLFNGSVVAEHKKEFKCIKYMIYYIYHKTPEHALKS